MSKKTYCAEDKCEIEILTKEEVEEELDKKQNEILVGNNEPSESLGNDGDIYLQYS